MNDLGARDEDQKVAALEPAWQPRRYFGSDKMQQQQQQQQTQQLEQDSGHAAEPSQQALAEASRFRVRTARRRHLDFDDEYDLADVSAPQRSKWSGPFHFIQAADCQFGMIDSYVHHRTEPGWREEIELCERLVSLCHQMQPKPLFMIICGDLVDSLPASEIGRRQVVDFKRIFAKLDPAIPLVCVCGNHDVGDEPTSKTVSDYKRTFGDDYFYFTKNDILFIVINSQFYQNRDHVQDEAREQDQWLEGLLAKCRLFKYSIIFEHIPWFLEDAEEQNDYFNIRKEVRLEWLRKFKDAGVTKIMCGHYHRNAGGWFQGMELVVTSAIGAQCGTDKSGIRIVKVLDKSIEHKYYAMEDVPLRIELGQ
uniref:Serine/threonine-protein phosphatase CPPED1 n=1 Tax=Aceria tosichella TaxID=561515 RepID=A0A6G1S612_9ACAR